MIRQFKIKTKSVLGKIIWFVLPDVMKTSGTAAPVTIRTYILQKIFGFNRQAYWPTHFTSVISAPSRISIGVGTAPGLSPGCYIQGSQGIKLGDYSLVAPGVGLISANHNVYDISLHEEGGIVIGKYCWIGMNAVILPGVVLGDHTVVAAGSIVTKSFAEGFCVIGGVPAQIIKKLDPNKVVEKTNEYEYIGYFAKDEFMKRQGVLLDINFLKNL